MLVAYVAHQSRANRPASDGSLNRAHWEAAAARGNVDAMKQLRGPDFPDALEYLYGWFHELSNARTESMAGIAPLTYAQIDAWARLTDRQPEPYEVSALLEIDQAFRAAHRDEPAQPSAPDAPVPVQAWPTKKAVA